MRRSDSACETRFHERNLLHDFLVNNKPPAFIRQQNRGAADSGKRAVKIKSKDGQPVVSKTAWAKTILDIRMENAKEYCEDVTAWARPVLGEAEAITMQPARR